MNVKLTALAPPPTIRIAGDLSRQIEVMRALGLSRLAEETDVGPTR
jgi:hypothetical protein